MEICLARKGREAQLARQTSWRAHGSLESGGLELEVQIEIERGAWRRRDAEITRTGLIGLGLHK